jgi:protein-tyrosine phosphatase
MATPGVRFRAAESSDLPLVVDLLAESTRWLNERGEPSGWPIPFPEERLRPAIEAGELFVVEGPESDPLGVVTLQWDDPAFWGPRPPDAGYIHRFVVRRSAAGRGIGDLVLRWVDGEVRARDRPFVRLDCLAASAFLRRYYEQHGFRRVGAATVGGLDCSLFEKQLARERPPGDRGP